ncbi:hypothetical protein C0J52_07511 [Blattella germanica]|nr:hypothetical protein C0J52_07511 [Blattella germanica]
MTNETDDSKENGDLQEKHPADAPVKDDDLSNVSVKELKSTYANQIQTKGPKEVSKEIDEDILHCGSVQSLKQNYCSEALKSFKKAENPEKKEVIATGISIKELRRSFGDLSTLCDNDDDEGVQHESAPISLDMKARSMGDLRRLSDTFHNNSMDSNKSPIHTGVSVRALCFCKFYLLLCANLVSANLKKKIKSSFSKFDQMSKKTVLHVRSVDTTKVQKQFNESTEKAPEQTSNCKSCGKQVFQMEQIKAERAVWHKNCFRCKECNKQLTLDIYSSHEGQLYCKPHFRELFKPKAVVEEDNEPPRLRKPELIIRENQPIELPPEVVRASDKPDLGLEELSALNVKSRYQVFEKPDGPAGAEVERSPSSVSVKRSPSILSKLARFQAKGMDIGVTDESLNGIPYEESSSSSEEENEIDGEEGDADRDLIRSNRKQRERPGKQGKMKEMYEQAVKDSENTSQKKEVGIRSDKAKSIKERFERGEVLPDEEDEENKGRDDRKSKSRSLFLELDASAAKTQQQQQPMSPLKSPLIKDDVRRKSREIIMLRTPSEDVVKSSDAIEEVEVATAEISNKFKFFETYKAPEKERKLFRITPPREGQVKANSPEREIYRDPEVVRSEDKVEDEEVMKTNTAKKMLSIFRQMEENATKEDLPDGPKPLKRFTPPPEYTRDSESSEEETESEDEEEEEEEDDVGGDPNIEKENKANANAATNASHAVGNLNGGLELDQSSEHASIDTTKSLRARFESLKNETQQPKERTPRPKVNRFVLFCKFGGHLPQNNYLFNKFVIN